MENIKQYDQFVMNLDKKIKNEPAKYGQIIVEALKTVQCPYLKEKLKEKYK